MPDAESELLLRCCAVSGLFADSPAMLALAECGVDWDPFTPFVGIRKAGRPKLCKRKCSSIRFRPWPAGVLLRPGPSLRRRERRRTKAVWGRSFETPEKTVSCCQWSIVCEPPSPIRVSFSGFSVGKPAETRREVGFFGCCAGKATDGH